METDDELCAKFEAELASIAALDQLYYTNPSPTLAERREYAAREVQLEEMRSRFYEEFRSCRQVAVSHFRRRCRSIIRRLRPL